ncbi:MAG: RNA pyrophosphohydrolase [Gammaproteobacteria bacterium]|nr:RNA pyrophosphohydrolase [Gammaproteobacteria bacterium]
MKNQVYRPNIGIILLNKEGKILLAERNGMPNTWQLPQGGIDPNESPLQALYREVQEEIGLLPNLYNVLAVTSGWIYYQVPYWQELAKFNNKFRGQKQKWFLLEFLGQDNDINLQLDEEIEFINWQWASYWYPLTIAIDFKLGAYRQALMELLPVYRQYMIEK